MTQPTSSASPEAEILETSTAEISTVETPKSPQTPRSPRLVSSIQAFSQAIENFKNIPEEQVSANFDQANDQNQLYDWALLLNHPEYIPVDLGHEELKAFGEKMKKEAATPATPEVDVNLEIKKLGPAWYANLNKLPQTLTPKQKLLLYHLLLNFLKPKPTDKGGIEQEAFQGNAYKTWRYFNNMEILLIHKMSLLNTLNYAFKADEARNAFKDVLLEYCVARSKGEVNIFPLIQYYSVNQNQENFSALLKSEDAVFGLCLRLAQSGSALEQAFALKALADAISTDKLPQKFLSRIIRGLVKDKSKWTDEVAAQKLALLLAQTNGQKNKETLNLLLEEDTFLYDLLPKPKAPPIPETFAKVLQSNFAVFQAFELEDVTKAIKEKFAAKNTYEALFAELNLDDLPLAFDAELAALEIIMRTSIPLMEYRVMELKDLEGIKNLEVVLSKQEKKETEETEKTEETTKPKPISWKMCLRFFTLKDRAIVLEQVEVDFAIDTTNGSFTSAFTPDLKIINATDAQRSSLLEKLGMYAAKAYFVKSTPKNEEPGDLELPPASPVPPIVPPAEVPATPEQPDEEPIPPTLASPEAQDFANERKAQERFAELVLNITQGDTTVAPESDRDNDAGQLMPAAAAAIEANNNEVKVRLTQTLGPSKKMLIKLMNGETEGVDFEKIYLHQKVKVANEEGGTTTQYHRVRAEKIKKMYESREFESPTAMENLYLWNIVPHTSALGYKKILNVKLADGKETTTSFAKPKVVEKSQVEALDIPADIISALMFETKDGKLEFYEVKKNRLKFSLQKLLQSSGRANGLTKMQSEALIDVWERGELGKSAKIWQVVRNERTDEATAAYKQYLEDGFPPLGELLDDVKMSYPIQADAVYEKAPIKRVMSDEGEFILEEQTRRYHHLDDLNEYGEPKDLRLASKGSPFNENPFILQTTIRDMNARLAEVMQGKTWVAQMLKTVRAELDKRTESIRQSTLPAAEKLTQIHQLEKQWVEAYQEGQSYRNAHSEWLDRWEAQAMQEVDAQIAEVKAIQKIDSQMHEVLEGRLDGQDLTDEEQAAKFKALDEKRAELKEKSEHLQGQILYTTQLNERLEQLQAQKTELKEIQAITRSSAQLVTQKRNGENVPAQVRLPFGFVKTSTTFNIGNFIPLSDLKETHQ